MNNSSLLVVKIYKYSCIILGPKYLDEDFGVAQLYWKETNTVE